MIKKFIKNLDETILANLKLPNTNTALLDREKEILEVYLPKQLSKEELTEIIKSLNTKNMGDIMKNLKENHAGLYDGKMASEIVKSL